MDVAYDKVQEKALPEDAPEHAPPDAQQRERAKSTGLNAEVKEALNAFQNSPWGTTLGGWWGAAKKQGETYYESASREFTVASAEASKGNTDLISNTQVLSMDDKNTTSEVKAQPPDPAGPAKVPDSLPADILKEAGSIVSLFRSEAGARLKQVQKAEDAADEALLKFGTNVRDYLKEAITITAPVDGKDGTVKDVLFESKDADGRRVVHATRFDAQLHVIHSTLSSFNRDPTDDDYANWKSNFDAEKKTGAIAEDLAKYDDLRRAMEKLVPETVEYATFWTRYYFLRHVIETQEQKRRELLKGSQAADEVVGWGDEDDDDKSPATPKMGASLVDTAPTPKSTNTSVEPGKDGSPEGGLKLLEGRRSNENSVADSDASYDIVSGQASRGPDSPREEKEKKKEGAESDEEDWE